MIAGDGRELSLLREAWDDDPRVVFEDVGQAYDDPMATVAGYQRMADQHRAEGRRVRVSGPMPNPDDPVSRRRWLRYEAVVARALAPYDLIGLCRYDTRTMPTELVDHARATHQRLITRDGVQPGGHPDPVLAELARTEPTDPVEGTPPVLRLAVRSATDLPAVRAGLATTLPDAPRSAGLVVATNEVVSNALVHGQLPVEIRVHRGPGRWVCVVADAGPGLDPYAGFDSPLAGNPDAPGHGLWIARQLCDDLTIRSGAGGTTVRLVLDAD